MVKGVGAIFAENLQPWIRAFFSISLTTNILATCECPVSQLLSPLFPLVPLPASSEPIARFAAHP